MSRKGNEEVYPMEEPKSPFEFDTTQRYHNKTHKVTIKATGETFYGIISKVDYDNREFYLLADDQPGMVGKDGRKFSWNDCTVVAESNKGRIGAFSDNMIPEWESWDRKSGVGIK